MDKKILQPAPSDNQTLPSNQTSELALIQNITSTQNKVFQKMAESITKSSTQGAITAMSVFFLGIALVVLGLKMTSRVAELWQIFQSNGVGADDSCTCDNCCLPNWNRN